MGFSFRLFSTGDVWFRKYDYIYFEMRRFLGLEYDEDPLRIHMNL